MDLIVNIVIQIGWHACCPGVWYRS